jgi:RNA polymerase sigma-70 factor (ECF subfamily)
MNDEEFRELTEKHRRELTVHCYRMLGSLADAEDMLQETLLRAWRGIAGFEGRSSLRTWLYRIATNTCLDALAQRKRRALPSTSGVPGDPAAPLPAPATDLAWIGPLPDQLLAGGAERGPEARYSERESVALAFVTTLQTLPARQRSALLLRDVIGFSADETGEILGLSTAAVNSALQRARRSLEEQAGADSKAAFPTDDDATRHLLERFVRAWEAADVSELVALLREDAVFSMPPLPLFFQGRESIRAFLSSFIFASDRSFRVVSARANGQPAVAIYQRDEAGRYRPAALDVLCVDGAAISAIHAFLVIGDHAPSFSRFGLPDFL